jgi:GntR family transcriptional regulator
VVAISRVLAADGLPVAVMTDIVHPAVELPDEQRLRTSLERGEMVLDVLIAIGIPVTFSRTHVIPTLITPRERAGRLLGIRSVTAALELDELIYAGQDERVAYSRDLFAPGGLDVTVLRSLESERPAPVVNLRRQNGSGPSAGR